MGLAASGRSWAIATPHVNATDAGAVAFERGGNAVDAALHAATTLAVSYPHMCGVGGDLFALVQRPDGEVLAIASSGRSPRAADPQTVRGANERMPVRGPVPITVPGAVAGWKTLHHLGATLPWADAFTHATALAFGGISVSRSLAGILSAPDAPHANDPGLASIFYPDGAPAPLGAQVTNPALGATLQAIAGQGPDALYRGEVGSAYVDGLRAAGSPITTDDLAAHKANVLPPLRAPFRDLHVSVVPPNSQGLVLLEILATIERLGLDPDPFGPDVGSLAHAFAAASRDRDRHLADPEHMRIHPAGLLDDGHLAALADEVRDGIATPERTPTGHGDTIALTTADTNGWGVSLIQSLFWDFGAGILEPKTGIVAQNRGACFAMDAEHPNAFAPGKLPLHTLMPVLVHDERGLAAVGGSMGGYGQPQINAHTVIRAMTLGEPPHAAVAAPRWLIDSEPDSLVPVALVEDTVPGEVPERLAAAGFVPETVPIHSEGLGHAHLIRVRPNALAAGSDPRADGSAASG
jgi:gamma-glutamyltranspeptidase / glutathione hydrolase